MANVYHRTPTWGSPPSSIGLSALGVWSANGGGSSSTVPAFGRFPIPATLNGTATRTSGAFGKCVTFDGTAGCYLSAVPPNTAGTRTFYSPASGSVVFWFRTTQTLTNTCLTALCNSVSSLAGFEITDNSGGVSGVVNINVKDGAATTVASINSAGGNSDGNWHFVAATFVQGNGKPITLWIDGKLAGSATTSGSWNLTSAVSDPIRWGISVDG